MRLIESQEVPAALLVAREPGGPSGPAIGDLERGSKPGVSPPRGSGVGPKRGLFRMGSIGGRADRVGRVVVGFPRIKVHGIRGMIDWPRGSLGQVGANMG